MRRKARRLPSVPAIIALLVAAAALITAVVSSSEGQQLQQEQASGKTAAARYIPRRFFTFRNLQHCLTCRARSRLATTATTGFPCVFVYLQLFVRRCLLSTWSGGVSSFVVPPPTPQLFPAIPLHRLVIIIIIIPPPPLLKHSPPPLMQQVFAPPPSCRYPWYHRCVAVAPRSDSSDDNRLTRWTAVVSYLQWYYYYYCILWYACSKGGGMRLGQRK